MDLNTAILTYKPLTQKVLKRLADDNIIDIPLTEGDQQFLSSLCRIWTSEWYVAQMNKGFKPDKRVVMLAFPEFGKIERYILSTYLNLKPRSELKVRDMARRISMYFNVDYPQIKIRRVRQIAYNLRRDKRRASLKRTIIQLAMLEGTRDKKWS